jgi:hypothetical protein
MYTTLYAKMMQKLLEEEKNKHKGFHPVKNELKAKLKNKKKEKQNLEDFLRANNMIQQNSKLVITDHNFGMSKLLVNADHYNERDYIANDLVEGLSTSGKAKAKMLDKVDTRKSELRGFVKDYHEKSSRDNINKWEEDETRMKETVETKFVTGHSWAIGGPSSTGSKSVHLGSPKEKDFTNHIKRLSSKNKHLDQYIQKLEKVTHDTNVVKSEETTKQIASKSLKKANLGARRETKKQGLSLQSTFDEDTLLRDKKLYGKSKFNIIPNSTPNNHGIKSVGEAIPSHISNTEQGDVATTTKGKNNTVCLDNAHRITNERMNIAIDLDSIHKATGGENIAMDLESTHKTTNEKKYIPIDNTSKTTHERKNINIGLDNIHKSTNERKNIYIENTSKTTHERKNINIGLENIHKSTNERKNISIGLYNDDYATKERKKFKVNMTPDNTHKAANEGGINPCSSVYKNTHGRVGTKQTTIRMDYEESALELINKIDSNVSRAPRKPCFNNDRIDKASPFSFTKFQSSLPDFSKFRWPLPNALRPVKGKIRNLLLNTLYSLSPISQGYGTKA